jgi:hypothetical protein
MWSNLAKIISVPRLRASAKFSEADHTRAKSASVRKLVACARRDRLESRAILQELEMSPFQ